MMVGRMRFQVLRSHARSYRESGLMAANFLLAVWSALPAAAIVLNQIDDFQSGTFQSWAGGSTLYNWPNGGPRGTGGQCVHMSSGHCRPRSLHRTISARDY